MKHIKRFKELNEELNPETYIKAGNSLKYYGKEKRGNAMIEHGIRKKHFIYNMLLCDQPKVSGNIIDIEVYDPKISSQNDIPAIISNWENGNDFLRLIYSFDFERLDGQSDITPFEIMITLGANNEGLNTGEKVWYNDNFSGFSGDPEYDNYFFDDDNLYVGCIKDGVKGKLVFIDNAQGGIYYVLPYEETKFDIKKAVKAGGFYNIFYDHPDKDKIKPSCSKSFKNGSLEDDDIYAYYDECKVFRISLKYDKDLSSERGIFSNRRSAFEFKKFLFKTFEEKKNEIFEILEIVGGETEDIEQIMNCIKNIRVNALYDDEKHDYRELFNREYKNII